MKEGGDFRRARSCAAGWPIAGTVVDEAGLAAALPAIRTGAGPVFNAIKVKAGEAPLVMPPKEAVHLKDRFRQALLGHV